MSYLIATAGKGGTGKTTVAALGLRYLLETGRRPVLAVDADADSGLNELLGMPMPSGLGRLREGMREVRGMSKEAYFQAGLNRALEEGRGFDLLAMGRPEGPGCYCAANAMLSRHLDILAGNYPWVIIDNEAGLEHISRLVSRRLDLMLIVCDPSRRGLRAAERILALAREVNLQVGNFRLVINRLEGFLAPALAEQVRTLGLGEAHIIPADPLVSQAEAERVPLLTGLSADSPALGAMYRLFSAALPVA
ncbi:MAG: cellulose synthase operon protein YhjQ/BcsQ [Pseudomonadota bacterium]